MNRVALAIQDVQKAIVGGNFSQEKLDSLHKDFNMEFDEYCRFQELKSLASMHGWLTLAEANTVYSYLGNTVETFNRQSLPVKVTLTRVFENLLKRKLGL